jgi:hypothetical protein
MRFRLAVFMLFAALPIMNVWAAPAPEPYAILDIGPPSKGTTPEQYRKDQIEALYSDPTLGAAWRDRTVRNLPSIAPFKDARPWLAKNLRITEEDGGRRLRFTFQAGTRDEQAAILNALLRALLYWQELSIKGDEEWMRIHEKGIRQLEEQIRTARNPQEVASHQQGIDNLRTKIIPAHRAEIARLKQYEVIRWAK